jgi:hypothetical protein
MHNEVRTQLRAAVARGDGNALVQVLISKPWPEHSLQLIGDGLLVAFGQGVQEASGPAGECVAALRERDWEGDDELANSLKARLGTAAIRALRPLTVDLEELATVLEGDPVYGGGRIDLRNGEVWPNAAIEYAEESGELDSEEDGDPQRWLWVDSTGSRSGYRDMEQFIADIDDPEVADRLSIAISGRGAFRRFRDTLSRWPDLFTRWQAFSDDRQRGRARAWLADEGYTPPPQAPAVS